MRRNDVTYTASERSLAQVTFSCFRSENTQFDLNRGESHFTVMLLLYMTVSCVLFGSSAGVQYVKKCYGDSLTIPFEYTPPVYKGPVRLAPSNWGSSRLLMDNGKGVDPRVTVFFSRSVFRDLRFSDQGTLSALLNGNTFQDVIRLTVEDCATEIQRYYGDIYNMDAPRQAEFLEFTPLSARDQVTVLWNRTNPLATKSGRGQMKRGFWEMKKVTQDDSGHYNFRKKDNTLLSRIQLTVEVNEITYNTRVNKQLIIYNPHADVTWNVKYIPYNSLDGVELLVSSGTLVPEYDGSAFSGRIQLVDNGIEIDPVKSTDSGTYEFRDVQANLAQVVSVNIEPDTPTFLYVGVAIGILVVMTICCCCVRRCCCKKSSSKRNQSVAAPAVHYHDNSQPAGPSYSTAPATDYSRQTNAYVSREPATTSAGPSVYTPGNVNVNPPKPEVTAPAGQRATFSLDSDCLSSYPEPSYELKGLAFLSAPPLGSDSTVCDVYTSDKLNFL